MGRRFIRRTSATQVFTKRRRQLIFDLIETQTEVSSGSLVLTGKTKRDSRLTVIKENIYSPNSRRPFVELLSWESQRCCHLPFNWVMTCPRIIWSHQTHHHHFLHQIKQCLVSLRQVNDQLNRLSMKDHLNEEEITIVFKLIIKNGVKIDLASFQRL